MGTSRTLRSSSLRLRILRDNCNNLRPQAPLGLGTVKTSPASARPVTWNLAMERKNLKFIKVCGLMLTAIAAIAFAQDVTKLGRVSKAGEKDEYRMTIEAVGPNGGIEGSGDLEVRTLRTLSEGQIESQIDLKNAKFEVQGQPAASAPNRSLKVRLNDRFAPMLIESGIKPSTLNPQMSFFAFFQYLGEDEPSKGKPQPIRFDAVKGGESRYEGNITFIGMDKGLARLHMTLDAVLASAKSGPRLDMYTWIDPKSGKPRRVEGTISRLPNDEKLKLDVVQFTLVHKAS